MFTIIVFVLANNLNMDSEKCLYCGKNRDNLHHKNWARHVESCNKKRKRNGNSTCDIKKFFLTSAISSKPTQMSSTLTQGN